MDDHTRRPSALELLDKTRSARSALARHPDQTKGNSVVHYAYHACDSIEQGLILLDIDIILLQRRLEVAEAALNKIVTSADDMSFDAYKHAREALNKVKAI